MLPTHGFSVTAAYLRDFVGPRHRHPAGEVLMIIPIDPAAAFDHHGRGWFVYQPGSIHAPTATGGAVLVLFFLPNGAIECKRS